MSCDVRYIDGRNHILDLISAYVKKESKKKAKVTNGENSVN